MMSVRELLNLSYSRDWSTCIYLWISRNWLINWILTNHFTSCNSPTWSFAKDMLENLAASPFSSPSHFQAQHHAPKDNYVILTSSDLILFTFLYFLFATLFQLLKKVSEELKMNLLYDQLYHSLAFAQSSPHLALCICAQHICYCTSHIAGK